MSDKIITNLINKNKSYCLNEKPNFTHVNLFQFDAENSLSNYLSSDCDEQLLLHFEFLQLVKISSIEFIISQDETAPKTIKLYVNKK